jgi:putative protease
MSVANSASLVWLQRALGARRFVLARECSLADIKAIRRAVALVHGSHTPAPELEIFAHGAMCVSMSGRCLMSQFRHGASANRGQCRQPCRREYRVESDDGGFVVGRGYVLSPRDLCTLPFIEKLLAAGVSSLKIEGRGRSPEYVGTVTRCYRRAVDFYAENRGKKGWRAALAALKQDLLHDLSRVYNRGFSSGFFLGRPLEQWAEGPGSHAAVRKEYAGVVLRYYPRAGVAEVRVESSDIVAGNEIMVQGRITGTFSQIAGSLEMDHRAIVRAARGSVVALKTERPARKHDRVYVLRPARRH